jgi:hypothetical protein
MGPLTYRVSPRLVSCCLWISVIALATAFVTGCGGSGVSQPKLSGNTSVVVLYSGTANDQLVSFSTTINTLTLTSQSGNTVSLLATPVGPEFIGVNGRAEPLVTVSVPQDIYTSATASLGFSGLPV